jgi:hypothetical protein
MHESSLYERNCFVTLTYSDEFCPDGLVPEHFVLFMKRLRFKYGPGIRFFHCGEYGDKNGRPHHHSLLFNHDFGDKRELSGVGAGKDKLYSSGELSDLWPFGFASIGAVSFASAGYIARYSLKKVIGAGAADWYMGRKPEYLTMSRRPGIGSEWIRKFHTDLYPSDELVVNGMVTKPPRFYDDCVAKHSGRSVRIVKARRKVRGSRDVNATGARLLVREVVKESAIKFLSRDVEV